MKFKVQSSKLKVRSLSVAVLLLIVASTITGLALTNQAADSYNLLANPGFEDEYSEREDPYTPGEGPKGELRVANGWELWYDNEPGTDCYNYRPEYGPEDGYVYTDPQRVRSGQYAQKMFTLYSTHTAGLYQRVAVPEGSQSEFSIWVVVWSSDEDDPHHSTLPGEYWLSVGIDPYGGTDAFSEQIIWSDEIEHYDEHVQLSVATTAQADHVTVFTKAAPVWCVKHNDSYWDDARLVIIGGNTVYFEPQHSSASFCNTTSVDIKVNAANFKAGQIKFTYNSSCADVTGWARNTSDFPMGTWESGTSGEEWITFSAGDSMTGIYTIGALTIHCESEEDCTTALDFVAGGSGTSKLFDEWGSESSATWRDGTFECTTGLCGDVAPYPGCDGQINMGDVSLLHSYVGHPGQYSLCCEPCGDVAPYPNCDGQINMGDVSLLHSYVGHPGQYNLCCEAGASSSAAPVAPTAAENEVNFVPRQSSAPFSGTMEVEIQVAATDFKSGQMKFTYNSTCADVKGWTRNSTDFPMGTWESGTSGEEWITFSAGDSMTGIYTIGALTIHCESEEDCTTALDFVTGGSGTSKLFDDWGNEISATWTDGTFRSGVHKVHLPLILRGYP